MCDSKWNDALPPQTWLKEHPTASTLEPGRTGGGPAAAVGDRLQAAPPLRQLTARLNYSNRLVDTVDAVSELSSWLLRGKTRKSLESQKKECLCDVTPVHPSSGVQRN